MRYGHCFDDLQRDLTENNWLEMRDYTIIDRDGNVIESEKVMYSQLRFFLKHYECIKSLAFIEQLLPLILTLLVLKLIILIQYQNEMSQNNEVKKKIQSTLSVKMQDINWDHYFINFSSSFLLCLHLFTLHWKLNSLLF